MGARDLVGHMSRETIWALLPPIETEEPRFDVWRSVERLIREEHGYCSLLILDRSMNHEVVVCPNVPAEKIAALCGVLQGEGLVIKEVVAAHPENH